jgi:hypothetical protein
MSATLAFIVAHASEHAIRFMCRVLGIARSWFHAWQRAAPKRAERTARRDRLGAEIREIFAESKGRSADSCRAAGPRLSHFEAHCR